jgi:hypothetical protein
LLTRVVFRVVLVSFSSFCLRSRTPALLNPVRERQHFCFLTFDFMFLQNFLTSFIVLLFRVACVNFLQANLALIASHTGNQGLAPRAFSSRNGSP